MIRETACLRLPFPCGGVANLSTFRELELSLGVVPPPKFDEAQKQYRTMASNQSMTIVIPKPNADPERTGVICSALGAFDPGKRGGTAGLRDRLQYQAIQ